MKDAWEPYRRLRLQGERSGHQSSHDKEVPSVTSKKKPTSKHITSIFDSDNCSDDDLSRDEIAEYLGEKVLTRNSDVLTYWKSKEVQWPRLAKMAKDFLAPTATSASSERVFSSGRDLLGITRYRLLPETMEAAICLRSWQRSGLLSLLSCE